MNFKKKWIGIYE